MSGDTLFFPHVHGTTLADWTEHAAQRAARPIMCPMFRDGLLVVGAIVMWDAGTHSDMNSVNELVAAIQPDGAAFYNLVTGEHGTIGVVDARARETWAALLASRPSHVPHQPELPPQPLPVGLHAPAA